MRKNTITQFATLPCVALCMCLAGCYLGDSKDEKTDPFPTKGPGRELQLEAVPIWVSSVVLPAGDSTAVFIGLSTSAGINGEPITIDPQLVTGGAGGPTIGEVIDLAASRLTFTISGGLDQGQTTIVAKPFDASKWPAQTVYLMVRDDKGNSWVFGTALVMPAPVRR